MSASTGSSENIVDETRYTISRRSGIKNTVWVAMVAMIIAPAYMYIAVGIHNAWGLAATTAGAAALAFALYAIRGLVGGISALSFSDMNATIERKRNTIVLAWKDIVAAKFETVNTTPWLTFVSASKKHRICLENFKQADRYAITQEVMNRIPQITTSTEDWIVLNRVPVSLIKRGIKIIRK